MNSILHALGMALAMFWEILWALILGFSPLLKYKHRITNPSKCATRS